MSKHIKIQHYYDAATATLSYLVWDIETRDALVIDPLLDYNHGTGAYHNKSVDSLHQEIKKERLKLHLILETHVHADHLSGAQALKKLYAESRIAISQQIINVRSTFCELYGISSELHGKKEVFDELIAGPEKMQAGSLEIECIPTPGHTQACTSFLIGGEHLFTGDLLMMPDGGTGRCDFPGGSAEHMYDSIMQLYKLPENTKVYVGHDYLPNGRLLRFQTSIAEEKASNIRLPGNLSREEFIRARKERDAQLSAPTLQIPSLQVNIFAGLLPPDKVLRIPLREERRTLHAH